MVVMNVSGLKSKNGMVSEDKRGSRKERTGFRIRTYRFEIRQSDLGQGILEKSQFSYSRYAMV